MADLMHRLAMKSYAGYVWSTYGITVVALLLIIWGARRQLRSETRRALRRQGICERSTGRG